MVFCIMLDYMKALFFYLVMCCAFTPFQASCMGKAPPQALAAVTEAEQAPPGEMANRTWRDMSPQEQAERMMKAFAAGYPEDIERAEYRTGPDGNGDWAVFMKGVWFYCAGGKLLPERLVLQKDSYARQSFYMYFPDLPEWKAPEGEMAERLSKTLENRRANPIKRAPDFFDTLWDAHSRGGSYENLARMPFLGRNIMIHKRLVRRLERIEERIRAEAARDPAVQRWITSIGSIGVWNWRNVAATASRSFHSYGTALDIQPADRRGLATYWQWTADRTPEWYMVPYSGRWHPPDPAVKAFEAYGFCWGGKWPLFDTMHFEYRPEIMLMHGMNMEDL
jgi:hypothetical protein